jgi:manganese-dependent inorganic pyrophosphatase
VMETTNPSSALNMKDALLDAIAQTKKDRWVDAMLFCIIDILNETNTTLVIWTDEENLIQNVFAISTHDGVADLWSRISRKKQLAAPLAEYFG